MDCDSLFLNLLEQFDEEDQLANSLMLSFGAVGCAVAMRSTEAAQIKRGARKRLFACDLARVENTSWQATKASRSEGAYYITVAMSPTAFDRLYSILYPNVPIGQRDTGGRPLKLPGGKYDSLAMTMFFLHTTATLDEIVLLFGVTASTVCRHIKEVLLLMSQILPNLPESCIEWPSHSDLAHQAAIIQRQYPMLEGVFGWADGCSFYLQSHVDLSVQELFYNGRKSSAMVNNFFVWSPQGTIIYARYDCEGRHHDSKLAMDFYEIMASPRVPDGYRIVADSAFQTIDGRILKPLSEKAALSKVGLLRRERQHPHPDMNIIDSLNRDLAMNAFVVSTRQAAEWGNRALLSACRRLTQPLPTNEETRRLIIKCSLYIHNYRTRLGALNQIRTVYESVSPSDWRFNHRGPTNHEQFREKKRRRELERLEPRR